MFAATCLALVSSGEFLILSAITLSLSWEATASLYSGVNRAKSRPSSIGDLKRVCRKPSRSQNGTCFWFVGEVMPVGVLPIFDKNSFAVFTPLTEGCVGFATPFV